MQTVTLEEAQAQLATLIAQIGSGENVVITRDDKPIAKLIPAEAQTAKPRPQFGSAKGMFTLAPDFDDPITDIEATTVKPHPQFGSAKGLGYMTPDFDEPLK